MCGSSIINSTFLVIIVDASFQVIIVDASFLVIILINIVSLWKPLSRIPKEDGLSKLGNSGLVCSGERDIEGFESFYA